MSEIKDGGPAFPVSTRLDETLNEYGHQDGNHTWQYGGLTVRDYFAAKAMQGFITGVDEFDDDALAAASYRMADAMLRARDAK